MPCSKEIIHSIKAKFTISRWTFFATLGVVAIVSLLANPIYSSDLVANGFRRLSGVLIVEHHHKDAFPLDTNDYFGMLLMTVGLMIAAAGGIGGGGLIVPILILVFGFNPKHAIALSNFTILGCSIMNVFLNLSKRHPDADRPLVDWDLIMVMEPPTMAGAVFGAYLSKILPDWFLVASLVLVLGLTSYRTMQKGIKQYKDESRAFEKKSQSLMKQAEYETKAEIEMSEKVGLLSEENQDEDMENKSTTRGNSFKSSGIKDIFSESKLDDADPNLVALADAERSTPLNKVLALVVMFIVVVVLNLLKGGGGSFHSPIGMTRSLQTFKVYTNCALK